MQQSQKEARVKILMLGESGVGKSSMLHRFTDDKFSQNFQPTLGVEYKQKLIELDGKRKIQVQVWDTAGQERFQTITPIYYRSVDGVVLVYDITDRGSFEKVSYWIQNLKDNTDCTKTNMVLVGNKIDMVRNVNTDEGMRTAEQFGMNFFESSAKTGQSVKEIFNDLTKQIMSRRAQQKDQDKAEEEKLGVILSPQEKKANDKKGCCD